MTENIRIIWTDTDTKEEKEIYNFNTSLSGLWHLKQFISEALNPKTLQTKITSKHLDYIEVLKKEILILSLLQNDNNQMRAAKALNMKRTTLLTMLDRHGVDKNDLMNQLIISSNIINKLSDIIKNILSIEMEIIVNGAKEDNKLAA